MCHSQYPQNVPAVAKITWWVGWRRLSHGSRLALVSHHHWPFTSDTRTVIWYDTYSRNVDVTLTCRNIQWQHFILAAGLVSDRSCSSTWASQKYRASCLHQQLISKEAGSFVRRGKCTISATVTSASCRKPASGGPLSNRRRTTLTTTHLWRTPWQSRPWTGSRAPSALATASSTCASPWYRRTCSRLSTCWDSPVTVSRACPPLCMPARARTWRHR